ncbi:hypothetical protein AB6B38_11880 [Glycocaulis abyssi]|uniref:Uncharacterized protein n=1 Tax=Glycocaulis abyssi TaxID=1433403 RepID=A0ABV9NGL6_9PROT
MTRIAKIKAGKDKKNPQSLRFLLIDIANHKHRGNITQLARTIKSSYASKYGIGELTERSIRRNISEILYDERRIEYWHIEVFANMIGVTSGQLLLFSRLTAEQNSSNGQPDIIRQSSISSLEKTDISNTLDLETLIRWAEDLKGVQMPLPLP